MSSEDIVAGHGAPDPRWIVLRPSLWAQCLRLGVLLAALATLALLPNLAGWLRGSLLLAVFLQAVWNWPRRSRRVTGVTLLPRERVDPGDAAAPLERSTHLGLRLRLGRSPDAGQIVDAEVLPNAFVTPLFVSIPYRQADDGRWRVWWPRVLPLWADQVEKDAFRRLRVRLRWH